MTVDTKEAPRRALKLGSIEEMAADLDRIEAGLKAGTLTVTGNWTAGQIMEHCNILLQGAMDGLPGPAPLFVRLMVKVFFKKKALSGEPMPSGYQLKGKGTEWLMPSEDIGTDQGLAMLRASVDRVLGGEKFTKVSPIFGKLSHEEWTTLQLGHCSMHLSFINLGSEAG